MAGQKRRVLVLDNHRDIAELVHAVLTDAGFEVSELTDLRSDAIRIAVGQQEPDCVLLDGECPGDFGGSWLNAAWMQTRGRPIPVIMFTADAPAVREARELVSERSRAARFEAVLSPGSWSCGATRVQAKARQLAHSARDSAVVLHRSSKTTSAASCCESTAKLQRSISA